MIYPSEKNFLPSNFLSRSRSSTNKSQCFLVIFQLELSHQNWAMLGKRKKFLQTNFRDDFVASLLKRKYLMRKIKKRDWERRRSTRTEIWSAFSWLNTKQMRNEMNAGVNWKTTLTLKTSSIFRACLIIWKRAALKCSLPFQLDVYFIGNSGEKKFPVPHGNACDNTKEGGLINGTLRRVATTTSKCIATERHHREFKYLQCDPGWHCNCTETLSAVFPTCTITTVNRDLRQPQNKIFSKVLSSAKQEWLCGGWFARCWDWQELGTATFF